MAARAVIAGVADATPKSGEGEVEMLRMLKSAKDSAVKARTQAVNQMRALVVTAPAALRETLDGLTATALDTGPDYDTTISFRLAFEPEDSQYGKCRITM